MSPARGPDGVAEAGSDARLAALDVLRAVLGHARPLDQALDGSRSMAGLDPRDRAFARLLVSIDNHRGATTTVRYSLGQ